MYWYIELAIAKHKKFTGSYNHRVTRILNDLDVRCESLASQCKLTPSCLPTNKDWISHRSPFGHLFVEPVTTKTQAWSSKYWLFTPGCKSSCKSRTVQWTRRTYNIDMPTIHESKLLFFSHKGMTFYLDKILNIKPWSLALKSIQPIYQATTLVFIHLKWCPVAQQKKTNSSKCTSYKSHSFFQTNNEWEQDCKN